MIDREVNPPTTSTERRSAGGSKRPVVQRKLRVGASHDPAELEAERTADAVVEALQHSSRDTASTFAAASPSRVARRDTPIRRYCGTPGCNDPTCHDPRNHGFDSVRTLRGRTVYSGTVGPSDIGTGTGTNKTTRTYVNSTPYPEQVAIEYNWNRDHAGTGGRSEFINQPLAPGQRADAGHIFGNQYGGYGNQPAAVFPQHPQTNRGNSYQGQPTRDQWRAHEDAIRQQAQGGHDVRNTVTIRDKARAPYYCRNCGGALEQTTVCPRCGTAH